jgi:hypothetical protein
MFEKPQTFRALIEDGFGGVASFAEATGIGEFASKKMRDRNSIAVEHWPVVIAAAKEAKGLLFTSDDFVAMQLRRKAEKAAKEARVAA